jgi:hypothetical protein
MVGLGLTQATAAPARAQMPEMATPCPVPLLRESLGQFTRI